MVLLQQHEAETGGGAYQCSECDSTGRCLPSTRRDQPSTGTIGSSTHPARDPSTNSVVAAKAANAICNETLTHRVANAHTANIARVPTEPRRGTTAGAPESGTPAAPPVPDRRPIQDRTFADVRGIDVFPSASAHLPEHQHKQRRHRECQHHQHRSGGLGCGIPACRHRTDHERDHHKRVGDNRQPPRSRFICAARQKTGRSGRCARIPPTH